MEKEPRLIDPNKVINKLGGNTIELGLNIVKTLPGTTIAMVQVAKAEKREDILRAKGIDDYSIPFDRLIDAFDSFILERSRGKEKTGDVRNYDLTKPRDLTILLLWQIRNIRTHSGGLIGEDQKSKDLYEKYFRLGTEKGLKPLIDLPDTLKPGLEFAFRFQDFKEIKKAIFDYISERIPQSDVDILLARSIVADVATTGIAVLLEIEKVGMVEIDLVEAYNHGCKFDLATGEYTFPSEAKYISEMNKICFASTGECISAPSARSIRMKLSK
ncbi:MAG: hypothetical protein M0Z77_09095 [Thermoplasmatales archaeon]|nr:hypothetical protein [Thermoplasmatales archaeon]